MTFVAIVTDLLPITYQKLNDDWEVQARVPKTTRASPETRGSSTSARSAARYSRSASRIAASSMVACCSAVWTAAPFPRFRGWSTTVTFPGQARDCRSSRVPSVEPSSTSTSSRLSTGSSAFSASSIAASTVERSLNTGMRIESPSAMVWDSIGCADVLR